MFSVLVTHCINMARTLDNSGNSCFYNDKQSLSRAVDFLLYQVYKRVRFIYPSKSVQRQIKFSWVSGQTIIFLYLLLGKDLLRVSNL